MMLRAVAVSLLLVLVLTGCEEDIALIDRSDGQFTLYGVLNPKQDTQYVHVFPIEGTLQPGPEAPLPATFTSTDLQTGAVRVWQDSLVEETESAGFGHVYWSVFRPAFEHTYRLEIQGDAGEGSRVEVEVPGDVRPLVQDTEYRSDVILPLRLEGSGVPHLIGVEVRFWGRITNTEIPPVELANREVPVDYSERVIEEDGAWIVPVNLSEGFRTVYDDFNRGGLSRETLEQYGIQLLVVTVDLIVANAAWDPPGGAFDPLVLAHPTVMTNVENGFGFVGAGYRIRQAWRPSGADRERVGFTPF